MERERLQRDVNMRQQLYTSLAQALDEARIREVRDTPVISVVETAWGSTRAQPRGRVKRGLMGLVLGFVLGSVLALTSGMMARRRQHGDPEADVFVATLKEVKGGVMRRVPLLRSRDR
jgi:uncharacterized protein involved in exopolysaccharide biosynthesis